MIAGTAELRDRSVSRADHPGATSHGEAQPRGTGAHDRPPIPGPLPHGHDREVQPHQPQEPGQDECSGTPSWNGVGGTSSAPSSVAGEEWNWNDGSELQKAQGKDFRRGLEPGQPVRDVECVRDIHEEGCLLEVGPDGSDVKDKTLPPLSLAAIMEIDDSIFQVIPEKEKKVLNLKSASPAATGTEKPGEPTKEELMQQINAPDKS